MIRCNADYHKSKVDQLPIFAIGVRDGIFNNPAEFDSPPITKPEFELLITDYNDKRGAYEKGGSAQKGPYQEAKGKLMTSLDTFAVYVNDKAKGNENVILLSGFVPTKSYRSEAPKPIQPSGVVLKRPATGVITAECANQNEATNYMCLVSFNSPLPSNLILNDSGQLVYMSDKDAAPASTGSDDPSSAAVTVIGEFYIDIKPGRKKTFKNLKLGSRYYFYFVASNAKGVSTFSDAVSIICG